MTEQRTEFYPEETQPAAKDVLIRLAEERDIPAVAALEKSCFSDAWSETSVRGTLNSPLGYVLIAEEPDGEGNDLPLGYLIASVFDGEGELLRIAAAWTCARRTGRQSLYTRSSASASSRKTGMCTRIQKTTDI